MSPKHNGFPMPEGVVEVHDEYQLNLAHYELLQLKPRGTIQFAGETEELRFQFVAGASRAEGIYAKLDEPMNSRARRVIEAIDKNPRMEALITITLLQFKMIFIAQRAHAVYSPNQKTLLFDFPTRILKTHRRKFIRIPFNDKFPASLRFQGPNGPMIRQLKDLSREGMRLRLDPGDEAFISPVARLKQAVLIILNREIPLGLNVVALYPGSSAGLKIIAMSEEDKMWIKDVIRILMKQILNLDDPRFDDQIEPDPNPPVKKK